MNEIKINKEEQKRKFTKYGVYAGMFILFGLCVWLIFSPSKKDGEDMGIGFNTDIPAPGTSELITGKTKAYEEERVRNRSEEKMRSLQEFDFLLTEEEIKESPEIENPGGNSVRNTTVRNSSTGSPTRNSTTISRGTNSFQSSSSAYNDINRTLGSFYEAPKEDREKEELRAEIEALKAQLSTSSTSPTLDDQVALLEKSYELAARYMPTEKNATIMATTISPDEINNGVKEKEKITPAKGFREKTVSMLHQPVNELDFVRSMTTERNSGFTTVADINEDHSRNTIQAVIHSGQTISDGEAVRIRLTESMVIGNTVIERNTVITGNGKIAGERLNIRITSLEYEGRIHPVSLRAYDTDGQEGIYIPGSMERNAVKEIAANMGQSLGSTINISQQSAGDQLLSDLGRGAIQGTSQYLSRKIREVRVTLKDGYRILLLPSDN